MSWVLGGSETEWAGLRVFALNEFPFQWRKIGREDEWADIPPALRWRIVDTAGDGIADASLSVDGTPYAADADGYVEVASLANGTRALVLSAPGYPTIEWAEYLVTRRINSRTVRYRSWAEMQMPEGYEVDASVGTFADGTRTALAVRPAAGEMVVGAVAGAGVLERAGTYVVTATGDVRLSTAFGPGGALEGTMIVPVANPIDPAYVWRGEEAGTDVAPIVGTHVPWPEPVPGNVASGVRIETLDDPTEFVLGTLQIGTIVTVQAATPAVQVQAATPAVTVRAGG